jgi:hypothetical protein
VGAIPASDVYIFIMSSKIPRKCLREECNNIIPIGTDIRQKYCSHSCASIVSNSPRRKHRYCPYCKIELTPKQHIYCSHKCHFMFAVKYKIENNYHVSQSSARSYYINIRGHKCEKCGLSIWFDVPIFLSLHHISGDFTDHTPSNVILLCGNCHPLTDTFGIKNLGNGRRINKKKKKETYKNR